MGNASRAATFPVVKEFSAMLAQVPMHFVLFMDLKDTGKARYMGLALRKRDLGAAGNELYVRKQQTFLTQSFSSKKEVILI